MYTGTTFFLIDHFRNVLKYFNKQSFFNYSDILGEGDSDESSGDDDDEDDDDDDDEEENKGIWIAQATFQPLTTI